MTARNGSSIPSVGRFEPAHGRQAELGETLAFVAVPDGVRPVPSACAVPIDRRGNGTFTPQGAASAARRRRELAKLPDFARQELEFIPAEPFAAFDSGRRGLLDQKTAEIVKLTGGASTGVMTTVRGYTWLIAFAEYYAVQAAQTGDPDHADRARRFFKDASIELAKAHELARAEAATRPQQSALERLRQSITTPTEPKP